ncbi:SDR family NAD(P)-dependent oxidoreductase [Neobacillus sp. PS3-34]|uniref:SDR family NAD(P)-dependent oxidoreductase n=1 Tax=Neobacillus sp. PS3-34 TaxID=3070678 RepID=UPI0027DFCF42|nr:SDR family NAD(P)-dependent oxidoreductase [Neobacillus sp. PS3-34]WML48623.1 SDR family NAD(P)-dependent oxidoreductase [Neobacillus sp. PS3-34]
MQKALVLGASGGMGYSIVKELSSRGIMVTAFARTREKLERLFADDANITICTGDVFRLEDLDRAANGVDIIFQSSNIPYIDWKEKLPIMMSNILQTSEKHSTKLAIVDNIYAYGRSLGEKASEKTEKNPHTKKGNIRLQVENLVKESKVPALIAHFPDFYGPNAENTILNYTLLNVVKDKKASYVGNQCIPREFIYTLDGAKAIVSLSLQEKAYGQNWNIPGYGIITGEEMIKTIREITGYQKGVSTVSKNMIRFMGLFNRQMREVVEMFYLNEEPVVLDGEKYEKLIRPIPRTSYREGLRQTIEYMKQNATI